MKKCKWCQTEIDSKAKVCPQCNKDLRNWFAKHPIWSVIIGLIILGMLGSGTSKTKPASTTVATTTPVIQEQPKVVEPEITVSAIELAKDFDENEIKANAKYKGKLIKITGKIDSMSEMLGSTFVVLSAGKEFALTQAQCFFDDKDEIAKIINMNKGDKVTIIGTVDGKSINVGIRECKFIN